MSKIIERNLPNMVGETIKAARKQKKLSIGKLGSLAGVSGSYIHRIETGERASVSTNILLSILRVLEIDVAKVMQIQPSNNETDLGLLLHMGQCTINNRQLIPAEKEFLFNCLEALETGEWGKKKKALFVLELLESVNKLKSLNI